MEPASKFHTTYPSETSRFTKIATLYKAETYKIYRAVNSEDGKVYSIKAFRESVPQWKLDQRLKSLSHPNLLPVKTVIN